MEFRSTLKQTLREFLVPDAMSIAEGILGAAIIAVGVYVSSCQEPGKHDRYAPDARDPYSTRASP